MKAHISFNIPSSRLTSSYRRGVLFGAGLLSASLLGSPAIPGASAPAAPMKKSAAPQAIIRTDDTCVTLVTTFASAPEAQAALIALLVSGTEEIMQRQPGFISSSVLRGEGGRVINYSQWRSRDDIRAMRQQPQSQVYFGKVAQISRFESALCDVEHVEVANAANTPAP